MNTRRNFLSKLAVSAAMPALWAGNAFAQTPPPPVKLEESDPVATALGYKEDTTKVDAAKYPMHKPEQRCDNCALYQSKPGETRRPLRRIRRQNRNRGRLVFRLGEKARSGETVILLERKK